MSRRASRTEMGRLEFAQPPAKVGRSMVENMAPVIRMLIERLTAKGIELSHIPAFIRNLANSLAENPDITFQDLNAKLKQLGWHDFELDVYTLQLVLFTLGLEASSARHAWA